MARPSRSPIKLKDGYYIEVSNKFSSSGIKIRRNSKAEIEQLIKTYQKSKDVVFLGQVKDGKFV
ncbi:MAG: hypothetical protein D6765_15160 [Bacteroidetes bacterium]|nr:MAG: hypothetical protein D6765_15160 [Bacteroidota bacterium]